MSTEVVGIYDGVTPDLSDDAKKGIVGALVISVFLLMAFEVLDPDIAFFGALVITLLTGILTMPEALSGFSNEGVITIATLFLVVEAVSFVCKTITAGWALYDSKLILQVDKSHVIAHLCRKVFGVSGSIRLGTARMLIACFLLSILVSNTPRIFLVQTFAS